MTDKELPNMTLHTNPDAPVKWLTKREAFAMAAMQGILSHGTDLLEPRSVTAARAIAHADDQIRALNRIPFSEDGF